MAGPVDNVDQVRSALADLKRDFGKESWYQGAGIAPAPNGDGFILRLNVDDRGAEGDPGAGPPVEYQGITVEVVRTRGYEPRQPK